MHIVHVALQGCLKSGPVEYGVTADTGGHIRYLLDLVAALEEHPSVTRQTIVTRGFHEPKLGAIYAEPEEALSDRTTIVRIFGSSPGYLSKEELWRDMPALKTAFLQMLANLPVKADVIQAHYADAGTLAAAAKARLGIPYIFAAHSLGAMKRLSMGADAVPGLARREAIEDEAIARADAVIASSRDEAEGQLPVYPGARPERIRVNPPGCDIDAFAHPVPADVAAAVAARIDAALDHPERPPILALARPVWRKNLAGLIDAYAADPELQARANLVIFAGADHDATMLSDESREVIAALYERVERHGLGGKVSLPRHHRPEEVAAIYAYAARRRGVFANPALHEPFGLTLVEAAAAGLPVVATDRGGPRDILADLRHGLLADPTDPVAVAAALRRIVEDDELREGFAAAGQQNVGFYTWARHADIYVRLARRLSRPARPLFEQRPYSGLLLSDIDGTLTGCPRGVARLAEWRRRHPEVLFAVATGRSLHDAIAVLAREAIQPPRILVTSVGTEIYYVTDTDLGVEADYDWQAELDANWDADGVARCLAGVRGLVPQPAMEQRRFKRSWFAKLTPDGVKRIERRLERAGLAASVIYSHDRFLDVIPRDASKGAALAHLRDRLGLPLSMTAAAGDSANDRSMIREAGLGIVVANHDKVLDDMRGLPNVVFSAEAHAGGIVSALSGRRLMQPLPTLPLLRTIASTRVESGV